MDCKRTVSFRLTGTSLSVAREPNGVTVEPVYLLVASYIKSISVGTKVYAHGSGRAAK